MACIPPCQPVTPNPSLTTHNPKPQPDNPSLPAHNPKPQPDNPKPCKHKPGASLRRGRSPWSAAGLAAGPTCTRAGAGPARPRSCCCCRRSSSWHSWSLAERRQGQGQRVRWGRGGRRRPWVRGPAWEWRPCLEQAWGPAWRCCRRCRHRCGRVIGGPISGRGGRGGEQ